MAPDVGGTTPTSEILGYEAWASDRAYAEEGGMFVSVFQGVQETLFNTEITFLGM